MAKCYSTKPLKVYQSKGNLCKDKLYYIATSKTFENLIFACIVLNTIGMSCTWLGEPEILGTVLNWINLLFAAIYTVECTIKVGVLGKAYFKNGWNNFDFVIVVVAWTGFFLEKVFKI
jgi:voltage-dependent calcium channel L type alpha-1D